MSRAIQLGDGYAQAVDLREGKLASVERCGDLAALPEQPFRIDADVEQGRLDRPHLLGGERAAALRRPPHEDAVGAEHRSLGIDHDAARTQAAQVQPPHNVTPYVLARSFSGAQLFDVGDQLVEPGEAGRVLRQLGDRRGAAAGRLDPHRIGTGKGRQGQRGVAGGGQLGVDVCRGVGDLLAGGETERGGEADRQRQAVDEAAFLQEQRGEGAAGGEELGELAGQRIGEMEADQRQDGAKAGIARRLAETGEQIAEDLHRGSFRAQKSRPKAAGIQGSAKN